MKKSKKLNDILGMSMDTVIPPKNCGIHSDDFKLIPYLDRYMTEKPNTGAYTVEDLEKPPDKYYHPSGDCLKCLRKLYYEKKDGDYETFSLGTMRTFKIGHAIHSMVQAWISDMGKLDGYPYSAYGSEVSAKNEELNISGSLDDVLRFPCAPELDVPLEIKTIDSQLFKMLTEPKTAHILQVRTYLFLQGRSFGIILYIEKGNPHNMKEYIIEAKSIDHVLDRWDKVTKALEDGKVDSLDREYKQTSAQCKRCPSYKKCWL